MNSKLNFEVNKEDRTIVIRRQFNAPLELVWKAWTTADLLDQWWGPEPCKAVTKSMDFRVGGHWLYCMIVPASLTESAEEQVHWGKQEFDDIQLHKSFSGTDVFCDENGQPNPELPQGSFENIFTQDSDEQTLVTMISKHHSFEDIETLIAMGFKEGITACFDQLDVVLERI